MLLPQCYLLRCLLCWATDFLDLLLRLLEQSEGLGTIGGSAYLSGPAKEAFASEQGGRKAGHGSCANIASLLTRKSDGLVVAGAQAQSYNASMAMCYSCAMLNRQA